MKTMTNDFTMHYFFTLCLNVCHWWLLCLPSRTKRSMYSFGDMPVPAATSLLFAFVALAMSARHALGFLSTARSSAALDREMLPSSDCTASRSFCRSVWLYLSINAACDGAEARLYRRN